MGRGAGEGEGEGGRGASGRRVGIEGGVPRRRRRRLSDGDFFKMHNKALLQRLCKIALHALSSAHPALSLSVAVIADELLRALGCRRVDDVVDAHIDDSP